MTARALTPAEMAARLGEELGVSRWFTIDQPMIDAFAALTEDDQFIHTDPERARKTPFGGTVAHGFLTLSLLSAMAYDAEPPLAGARMSVNYGFDRLRFVAPVPAGARVRGRFVLAGLEERRPGEVTLAWDVTVEIEGAERPALAARWLQRWYLVNGGQG
ncbi:Acyl dehydratase [Meinhardsimonia xiamenensis]|jgi:acyl dehydratase|uniref:Acyl dehydratase n=1 Tax=Meinhardsimonia xiamenensis TaxID=990712 RepID=A0A1G9AK05_9RHOB|nr:MaoC family dehydratase [Meinhardsimonia xiamenensis]PRX35347.1 acyl dehydratase [Meinhardsimonia xiamenensis]SDK27689.1 Acyl dehydratase [Meinhardsimonia xiamenensis]